MIKKIRKLRYGLSATAFTVALLAGCDGQTAQKDQESAIAEQAEKNITHESGEAGEGGEGHAPVESGEAGEGGEGHAPVESGEAGEGGEGGEGEGGGAVDIGKDPVAFRGALESVRAKYIVAEKLYGQGQKEAALEMFAYAEKSYARVQPALAEKKIPDFSAKMRAVNHLAQEGKASIATLHEAMNAVETEIKQAENAVRVDNDKEQAKNSAKVTAFLTAKAAKEYAEYTESEGAKINALREAYGYAQAAKDMFAHHENMFIALNPDKAEAAAKSLKIVTEMIDLKAAPALADMKEIAGAAAKFELYMDNL